MRQIPHKYSYLGKIFAKSQEILTFVSRTFNYQRKEKYALMPRLESIYSQKKKKLVYATAQRKETVTTDDIARHISSHNSVFSEGTIVGLLRDAQRCIMEHLMAGDRVDLDELGAFYTTLASRGARTTEEFDTSLIKSVNLKRLPSKRMRTEIQQVEL